MTEQPPTKKQRVDPRELLDDSLSLQLSNYDYSNPFVSKLCVQDLLIKDDIPALSNDWVEDINKAETLVLLQVMVGAYSVDWLSRIKNQSITSVNLIFTKKYKGDCKVLGECIQKMCSNMSIEHLDFSSECTLDMDLARTIAFALSKLNEISTLGIGSSAREILLFINNLRINRLIAYDFLSNTSFSDVMEIFLDKCACNSVNEFSFEQCKYNIVSEERLAMLMSRLISTGTRRITFDHIDGIENKLYTILDNLALLSVGKEHVISIQFPFKSLLVLPEATTKWMLLEQKSNFEFIDIKTKQTLRATANEGNKQFKARDALEEKIASLPPTIGNFIKENCYCPITQNIIMDPVVCEDGHIYEKVAILEWLRDKDISPVTRNKISKNFMPVLLMKNLIQTLVTSFTPPEKNA